MNFLKNILNLIKDKKIFFISTILIAIIFIIDIWTKRLAFAHVDEIIAKTKGIHTHIQVNDYFNIVKVVNTGISFGLFKNLTYGQYILSGITLIIVLFIIYLLWKSEDKFYSFVYTLIIAGGLGNLYDRIIYGGVFDFLDFHIKDYHWPAFNIADSSICIGITLLILNDLIKYIKETKSRIISGK